MSADRTSNVIVRITDSLKEKFIETTAQNKTNISDVLRNFIKFYVGKQGKWREEMNDR